MEKKDRVFLVSTIIFFSVTNLTGKRFYLSKTPGHVKGKFVVDPFPKTQATPESVYLNLHTNNDKKKIRWLGACQVEAVNNKN